jgi:thiol-disulfide isomerase/thioredoxin
MNTKTLIGFIAVIAVLGGAAYYLGRSGNGTILPPQPPPPPPPPEEVLKREWPVLLAEAAGPPRGNPKAPWTLIEVGDFECPNCGKAKPTIEQFIDQSGGKVKLLFVNFPLNRIHKNAEDAAEASMAASAQGKFWPMYDMLYGDQDSLVASEIEYHAANIPGLDAKKFTDDMQTRKYAKKVAESEAAAAAAGVQSTPTFLLRASNGKGEVTSYLGAHHDPKYKILTLDDLVQNPPWIHKPAASSTTVAAGSPGS